MMNLMLVLGVVVAVLIWAVRNTKVRRTTSVPVPLTPAERKMLYDQKKATDEELLAREAKGFKVIDAVLLRERSTGELGQAHHNRRDELRRALALATTPRRPKGVLKLLRSGDTTIPTTYPKTIAHKGK